MCDADDIGEDSTWREAWRRFRADRTKFWLTALIAGPLLAFSLYWIAANFFMPRIYSVGVLRGSPEMHVLQELSAALREKYIGPRLTLREFEHTGAIRDALDKNAIDFGVLRTDATFPANALSAVIFREISMAAFALDDKGADDVFALRDSKLGVLSTFAEADALARNTLAAANVKPASIVNFEDVGKAAAALKSGDTAAIIAISGPTDGGLARAARALALDAKLKVKLVDFPDIEQLTAVNPGLTAHKIAAGALTRKPKFPAEEHTAVKTEMRLVARTRIDRNDVSEIANGLYSNRVRIARKAPSINLIKTIDNDYVTSSLFPVHPGALDYFRRETMSFYERYNEQIWLLIFYGGSIASAIGWLVQRGMRAGQREERNILKAMSDVICEIQETADEQKLQSLARESEDLVRQAMCMASSGQLSHRRISAILLGQTAIDNALASARERARRASDEGQFASSCTNPERFTTSAHSRISR